MKRKDHLVWTHWFKIGIDWDFFAVKTGAHSDVFWFDGYLTINSENKTKWAIEYFNIELITTYGSRYFLTCAVLTSECKPFSIFWKCFIHTWFLLDVCSVKLQSKIDYSKLLLNM